MPPRLFAYAANALMPWNAPSNRPLTGPVVLAIVPAVTELDVRPTSVPLVGQVLPCAPTWPPFWLPCWPEVAGPLPPAPGPVTGPLAMVPGPPPGTVGSVDEPGTPVLFPTLPDPALRIAAAAWRRSLEGSRAPQAAASMPASNTRATARTLRIRILRWERRCGQAAAQGYVGVA